MTHLPCARRNCARRSIVLMMAVDYAAVSLVKDQAQGLYADLPFYVRFVPAIVPNWVL